MIMLQDFVTGVVSIAKTAHFDCTDYFKSKGYKQLLPYASEDRPRDT